MSTSHIRSSVSDSYESKHHRTSSLKEIRKAQAAIAELNQSQIRAVTLSNGCQYNGQMKEGKPHGIGKLEYVNGDEWVSYNGYFENGKMHGYGTKIKANDDVFEGTFENDMFKEGKYTKANGNFWEGTWKNEKIYNGNYHFQEDGVILFYTYKNGKCTNDCCSIL